MRKCPHCGGNLIFHAANPVAGEFEDQWRCLQCSYNPEPKEAMVPHHYPSRGGFKAGPPDIKICTWFHCKKEFEDYTSRRDKRFCSGKCGEKFWNWTHRKPKADSEPKAR